MSDQGLSIFDNPSEDSADEPTQVIAVGDGAKRCGRRPLRFFR